ncbi:MAG TPA: TIM barrel protein, partial [Kofleriaceae bacterium]|nr:TIM barrel protein [Kofleriaceae bacterium]
AYVELGYEGTQHGRGFPEGDALAGELERRGLRFAELYSALPSGPEGLAPGAGDLARRDLGRLIAARGEVLNVALDAGGPRDAWSGRASQGAPRWSGSAFDELVALLAELAATAGDRARVSFHPHTATWIEAPDEVEMLAQRLPGSGAGICLDTGHHTVGGGDPVAAVRDYGELVTHVHIKDVDPGVLGRLRAGELDGFGAAVRERIFTEPGRGVLDLDGVVDALAGREYAGWLMVEQDSSWLPPVEAARIGVEALRASLARVAPS